MILAIDVGNTHTVFGLWNGESWCATWRRQTSIQDTEDEIAAWLRSLYELSGFRWEIEGAVLGSVVPGANFALERLVERYFSRRLRIVTNGESVGVLVDYNPPHAVGADRLANALAALERGAPPIIVVDFGTATTFDTINRDGVYVGGAIMPGVQISMEALASRAAKLPPIQLVPPATAVGKDTIHSIQSGVLFGYAGAVDAVVNRIDAELGGGTTVLATGGLGGLFMGTAKTICCYEPTLTLDGLVIAYQRLERSH